MLSVAHLDVAARGTEGRLPALMLAKVDVAGRVTVSDQGVGMG